MAKKKPIRSCMPSQKTANQLWDILDDLSHSISLVAVAKDCLGYKNTSGDEYATLQTAIKQLLDCHKRFDFEIGKLEPKDDGE